MTLPKIVSRDEWLAARKELLTSEKESLRARDALNTRRRMLPMVRLEKDYQFDGPDGTVSLAALFDGQRQLIVQHFMLAPGQGTGCEGCTGAVDELSDGLLRHLRARGTAYAIVARAPLAELDAYRKERGWNIPFYSSFGSSFNYDFNVTLDSSVAPVMFNYRSPDELRASGFDWVLSDQPWEQPGMSCFLRDGSAIFHTYSTYARGTEQTGGAYGFLDMTALGRQEDWEEPAGRSEASRGAGPMFE
jgi:predicted dithiol-disulfide oxidoreductase (DUF899 family)